MERYLEGKSTKQNEDASLVDHKQEIPMQC